MGFNNVNEEDEMRFSDEKLALFYEEFKEHAEETERRNEKHDEQIKVLVEAQQKNTDAIATLVNETRDIIQLHKDLQGAARIGSSLQNAGIWLAKWGTIGVGLAAIWNWGLKHLTEMFS